MTTLQTLLFTPLLAALIVRMFVRQPQVMAAAGTVAAAGLWAWLRGVELSETAVILWGQPMLLTADNQALLLTMLASLSILFALAILFPSGDWFVAGGLIGFAFLAAALLAQTFTVAAILLLLGLGALAMTVQSGQAGSVRGSFRYLLGVLLAVPLLLIGNWQAETVPLDWFLPLGELVALAALLLLAGFPFHVWLQAMVNEAKPLSLVLVAGWAPIVPLTLLFQELAIHPNLIDATFRQLVMLSGGLTLLVAGFLAVTAVHLQRAIGNILLLDMALTILALLLPIQLGWETAVLLQIGRFSGLLLLAGGWLLLQRHHSEFPMDRLPTGIGRKLPLSLALFGVGLFSLLGLPLTVGFVGHWQLLTAVAEQTNGGNSPWWLPAVALLGLGLGAAGVVRLLTAMLSSGDEQESDNHNLLWQQIGIGIILLAALWVALNPELVTAVAKRIFPVIN